MMATACCVSLELISSSFGDAVKRLGKTDKVNTDFIFMCGAGDSDQGKDGVMYVCQFKVPEDAPFGKTYSFDFVIDENTVFSSAYNDLASTYTEEYAISHCKGCTATTPEFSAGGSRVKLANGGQYQITANADDLGYKSNNTDIAVISPGGLVTAIGEGTAVLTIYTENYDTTQILLTVTPAGTLIGDCDLDGAFSSADIAMLQNYLLGSESISDWQAADLCDDDVLDIFDLMRMRELLAK